MPVHLSSLTVLKVMYIQIYFVKQWRNRTVPLMQVKFILIDQISIVFTYSAVCSYFYSNFLTVHFLFGSARIQEVLILPVSG